MSWLSSTIRTPIIFRNRPFGLLWTGQLLSSVGSWLLLVAVPVYVFHLTGSTRDTGLTVVAEVLPMLVFGPVAGVCADRWPRLRIMIGSNLLGAASVSALMLVSSRSQLWLVLLAIFTENAGAAFFSPAYSGVVPALVGRGQDLNAANAWSSFAGGAVRIAGAPLGGALYTLGGFRLPVAIDAGTYLASAGLVAAISILAPPAAPPPAVASGLRGVAADLRAGVSALHADRVLAMLLFASSLFLLGNGALTALLVPYVVGDLGAKAASLGGLYCALGAGFLVSAYLGRRASASLRLRSWAVGLLVTETAAFAGLFNVHHFVLAFPFIGLVGVAGGAFLMLERTTIQRRAPDHVVGRISSAYSTVVMAATLGGALVASLIAAWAGRTAALNLAIGIVALGAVAAARLPGTVAAAPAPASA